MGSCISGNSIPSNRLIFHQDRQLQPRTQIYIPTNASLYNTLRKNNEIAVLYPGVKDMKNQVFNIIEANLDTMPLKDMKTLLNFKKILFIGDFQANKELILNKIKPSINYSKFYIIQQAHFFQFIRQYPIFKQVNHTQNKIQPKLLPILAIDSTQFVQRSQKNIKIYIHSSAKKNLKIYSLISIAGEQSIIHQPKQQSKDSIKQYYLDCLKSARENNIVLLHKHTITPDDILQILSTFLMQKFNMTKIHSYSYLKRSLPTAASLPEELQIRSPAKPRQSSSTIMDSQTKFKNLFKRLQEQSGADKTQRAYNLLNTLITNIYSNPNNQEMYRKVKTTNKQMIDLLSKYKNGVKLLNELGFNEKEQLWMNNTQSKYLKIFKTNLDIGFKKYKNKIQD